MLYAHHKETYQTRVGAGGRRRVAAVAEVQPLPTSGHIPYSGLSSLSPYSEGFPRPKLNI